MRIVHRTGRAGVAAARHAVIFAHRLAGDLAAGIEDALDDGGVDIGYVAFEKLAPIIIGTPARQTLSLSAIRRPASLPPGLPLIDVFTYQAPWRFSVALRTVSGARGYFTGGNSSGIGIERRIGLATASR